MLAWSCGFCVLARVIEENLMGWYCEATLRKGLNSPVFNLDSDRHRPLQRFTSVQTLQEAEKSGDVPVQHWQEHCILF